MSKLRHISNSRLVLRIMYYTWVAFPYPIRKPLTAAFLIFVLTMKKLAGVNRNNKPTPQDDLGNLSFWGVPKVDMSSYTLEISGKVSNPMRLTIDELISLESVERPIRMDCVGGFRNNTTMKGVPLATLFDMAGVSPDANAAVFHCADEYFTALQVSDLLSGNALMVYALNGEHIDRFGYPLRLAAPGMYGYKWAKWIIRIELVEDFPKGYWEKKGLPRRGKVGDIW